MLQAKRKVQLMVALGVLVAGAAAPAAAEYASFGFTTDYVRGIKSMKMMGHVDSDRDHKVSRDEFMKFHEELFIRLDKNGDGVISEEEWKSLSGGGK